MKRVNRVVGGWILAVTVASFGLLSAFSYRAQAQSQGNSAVFNSGGISYSTAFIDASVFDTGGDICGQIAAALGAIPSGTQGAVIDARGIYTSGLHGTQTCGSNPFTSLPSGSSATVLLPPSTIKLTNSAYPWVLTSNIHLVGEDPNVTVIQDDTGFGTAGIIQMGSSSCPSTGCTGISIENLTVDANSLGANGIVNAYAQDGSYVSNVWMRNMGAASEGQATLSTGLVISAPYSGPYSDIYFVGASASCGCDVGGGGSCTCPATACVQIHAQTRGLHGITCSASLVPYVSGTTYPPPKAAIYVDAINNSIEDVHVEGFYDGIVVGDTPGSTPSAGNSIANISGVFGAGPVYNTVHICNSKQSYTGSLSACTQNTSDPVSVSDT